MKEETAPTQTTDQPGPELDRALMNALRESVTIVDPPASPADRFAAIMWDYFVDGANVDGCDLQDAIQKSGLGAHRSATKEDIVGTKWEGEIEVGDGLTFLTPEGKACVNRGAKEVQNVR